MIGRGSQKYTTVELGIVTSITRQGEVKTYRGTWGSDHTLRLMRDTKVLVVSATKVDVDAAYEAARQHTYDGHPNQPKPFDSVDEAREFVRQFTRDYA